MATTRTTDPDVEALVASIRTRLMRASDRASALRYVHSVLDAWNGEPLAGSQADAMTARPRQREAEARMREAERSHDCQKHDRTFKVAFKAFLARLARSGSFNLGLRCLAHPYLSPPSPEDTTTPEDTLRAAGISTERQSEYQRRMSQLLGQGGARS